MRSIACLFAFLGTLLLCGASAAAADAPSPAANQAYLADNAKKSGVVVRPSGLQYRVLRSGFGRRPGPGDTVRVQYSGSLVDGAVIDGTSPGLPAVLLVATAIRGLGEALQLMHEGDRWQLVIPASLAFGDKGGGAVPPHQTLIFDITLMSATAPVAPELSDPQVSLSAMNRQQGTVREQGAILTIPQ